MTAPEMTHVLLDFFGTLADYSPSRTEQGYHRSHDLVRSMGASASYPDMLSAWTQECDRLDRRAAADNREYSMHEATAACLRRLLVRQPAAGEISAFADCYLAEWNTGVCYPSGMTQTVTALASRYRLAVVSNTHDAALVPAHLAAMGIESYFDAVITSIEVGWRKPHRAIYAEALSRLGILAAHAIFAGDTYDADYAGPAGAGLTAYLIDPDARHDIPADRRLGSLADLPGRLGILLGDPSRAMESGPGNGLVPAIEARDVSDPAAAHGQDLPAVLLTARLAVRRQAPCHLQADQDLVPRHRGLGYPRPRTGLHAMPVPLQHLLAVPAWRNGIARRAPGHSRVEQIGICR